MKRSGMRCEGGTRSGSAENLEGRSNVNAASPVRAWSITAVALPGPGDALRLVVAVGRKRTAHIQLLVGETSLPVAAHVPLVALVRLDQFTFSCGCRVR